MKIIDKDLFISEYSQMMSNPEYISLIEEIKKDIEYRQNTVFERYTNIKNGHFIDNQLYNEKNSAIEVLGILLDTKERIEKIGLDKLPGLKYLLEELNDRIEDHTKMIKTTMGGLSNGLTMSVFTETDLIIRGVNALTEISTCYEKEIDNLKKTKKEDTTMTEVVEDNS